MKERSSPKVVDHFSGINDPHIDRTKRHELLEIIVISICAVNCVADTPCISGKRA